MTTQQVWSFLVWSFSFLNVSCPPKVQNYSVSDVSLPTLLLCSSFLHWLQITAQFPHVDGGLLQPSSPPRFLSQTTTSISLSCCLQYLRTGPMNMWAHTYRDTLDLLPHRNRNILHTLKRTVNVLLSQKAKKRDLQINYQEVPSLHSSVFHENTVLLPPPPTVI